MSGCVSRWPRYPGGEPINFAISCECWNSAQSTLITARGSPNSTSAVASTTRVLPAPVGPKNNRFPTGRPGEFNPARNTWYKSTTACTASSCPTIFRRSPASKSRDSTLRWVGSSCNACAPTVLLPTGTSCRFPDCPVPCARIDPTLHRALTATTVIAWPVHGLNWLDLPRAALAVTDRPGPG